MGWKPQADGSCKHPFMMINDLGKTFGRATLMNGDSKSAVNFRGVVEDPDVERRRRVRGATLQVVHRLPRASEGQRRWPEVSGRSARATDRSVNCAICSRLPVSPNAIRTCRSTTGFACSSRSATRLPTAAARIQFFNRRSARSGGPGVPPGLSPQPSAICPAIAFFQARVTCRDDFVHSHVVLHLREEKRAVASHPACVPLHDAEVGADERCQIGLVDDEQIRLRNPGPPLRGILSPPDTSIT